MDRFVWLEFLDLRSKLQESWLRDWELHWNTSNNSIQTIGGGFIFFSNFLPLVYYKGNEFPIFVARGIFFPSWAAIKTPTTLPPIIMVQWKITLFSRKLILEIPLFRWTMIILEEYPPEVQHSPWKKAGPQKETGLPSTIFQGRAVKLWAGIMIWCRDQHAQQPLDFQILIAEPSMWSLWKKRMAWWSPVVMMVRNLRGGRWWSHGWGSPGSASCLKQSHCVFLLTVLQISSSLSYHR